MTDEQKGILMSLRQYKAVLTVVGTVEANDKKYELDKVAACIGEGIALIEELDITIRAMLGEFGDSCDACGGDSGDGTGEAGEGYQGIRKKNRRRDDG